MQEKIKVNNILNNILKKIENNILESEFDKLLMINGLYSHYNNNLKSKVIYIQNKISEDNRLKATIEIISKYESNNIKYIIFKGSVLARILYDDPYMRSVGDIDIYVTDSDYECALQLLYDIGYTLIENFISFTEHHFCLEKGNSIVELHKHFFKPYLRVANSFYENNIMFFNIDNMAVKTLNHTSLLIYLFMHHYMHVVDYGRYSNINIITNGKINIEKTEPQYKRFYEIALLIEKYNDLINWNVLIKYICTQPLNYEFKIIIQDFDNLFNGYIPSEVLNKIHNNNYIISDNIKLYYEIENNYKLKYKDLNFNELLTVVINDQYENNIVLECNQSNILPCKYYIDEYSQDKFNVNNTYIQFGTTPKSSEDLSYYLDFSIDDKYLYVNFDVTDDILVFLTNSEIILKDFSAALACDNCSIVIASGTGEYNYFNIFMYPVLCNNEISVIAYDMKDEIVNVSKYVNPKIEITEKGYCISARISLDYLKINNYNSNYFFMDVAVCDCDDVKIGRKSVMAFSSRDGYWYDPRKFAKMIINK